MAERVQMINFTEIIVLEAILHVIDNKNSETPEYSDLPIDVKDEKVYIFLKKHIIDSLKDDKTLKAKFNINTGNVVLDSYNKIIGEPESFVEQSKIITEHLFKFMVKRNISGGCVIISKYMDEKQNVFLAILKMDYNDAIIHEKKKIDGKTLNALIPRTNGLPPINRKLQKCAFIKNYSEENAYDLLVLDKQPNKTDEDVALFFYKYFLDCYFCNDIKTNTASFFRRTSNFIVDTYNDDPIKAKEKLSMLYSTFKSNDIFNVNAFAEIAFGNNGELKEKYIQEVVIKNDMVLETPIDKDFVEKKLKKVQLVASEGIEISVDSDVFDDDDVFDMVKSEENPGTYNISIKNVHLIGKWLKRKR
jgi:hypothetical protein